MTPAAKPTSIVLFDRRYVLLETNAPRRYDYGGIPLTPDVGRDYETRFVLIHGGGVKDQITRYHSGLYDGVVSDMYGHDQIANDLMKRMEVL